MRLPLEIVRFGQPAPRFFLIDTSLCPDEICRQLCGKTGPVWTPAAGFLEGQRPLCEQPLAETDRLYLLVH